MDGAIVEILTVLSLVGTCHLLQFASFSEFRNKLDKFSISHNIISPFRRERVLNFISVPVSRECLAGDGRRSGICLNPYECKIQEGVSDGKCALGFGVCCVFSETCGSRAFNNITYFVNPNFPGLSPQSRSCRFTVRKMAPQISQIRLDFVHFNLAQPNRKTGICETDVMVISSETTPEFRLCGINNGQHIYYDVEDVKSEIDIIMNLTKEDVGRLWEIKITQIEFRKKAPTGCMQYFTEPSGVIQTMNFADNGRHLADQDYTICVRQELGMCSIAYEPCDENSFRIGPPSSSMNLNEEGSGSGVDAPEARDDECNDRIVMPCDSEEFIMDRQVLLFTIFSEVELVKCMSSADRNPLQERNCRNSTAEEAPRPHLTSNARQILLPFLLLYHLLPRFRLPSYCSFPSAKKSLSLPNENMPGVCDLLHCGSSFCNMGENPCRIESSTIPFNIRVQFGPALREESPDDNLGMCLKYEQLPCS